MATTNTKSLIVLATAIDVFIFGFEPSTATSTNITLDANQVAYKPYYSVSIGSITSVTAFTDCFGDTTKTSQNVWLVVATTIGNTAAINYVSLPEFTETLLGTCLTDSWWRNPTNLRGTTCTPANACPTGQYFLTGSGCQTRNIISSTQTFSAIITRVTSRLMTHFDTNPATAAEISYSYVREIFAASGKTLSILSFQEVACQATKPIVGVYSTITMDNYIREISVSLNGQHVFATIYKREWEIESNNRLVSICTELVPKMIERTSLEKLTLQQDTDAKIAEIDKQIKYIRQYYSLCQARNPTPFNMYSYINYYSKCSTQLCPNFGYGTSNNAVLEQTVPVGSHLVRPTKSYSCEPGFYCTNSRRVICPIGFKCAANSMTTPVKCKSDETFGTTCTTPGMITEQSCDDGSVCLTATSVPLLAPPGFYLTKDNRKTLKQCNIGDFCPLAAFTATSLCPAGQYCTSPDLMKPIQCTTMYDANNNKIANYSMYCPKGTYSADSMCPFGSQCATTTSIEPCQDGYYCPAGTQIPTPCPSGFYCPSSNSILLCPSGFFCRAGSSAPTKCQYLVYCPPGTSKPNYAFFAILVDVCIVLFVLVIFIIVRIVNAYTKKKRAKERRRAKEKRLYEATSALPSSNGQLLVTKHYNMDYEFKDLAMVMKNNDRVIFEGVTGKIKHSKITVIMGCSEDVRTALLGVFSGKSYRGWIHGELKVNGKRMETMAPFHNIIRSVPKYPSMPKELRVSEVLRFNAHQNLRNVSYSLVQKKVQNIMHVFDLLECQHDLIGIEKKGLNDVHRQFLNVALEVVAEPNALFVEAPVEGLSLSDAKNMVRALKEVAQSGVTVVLLGDRPRNDIFLMYDNVLFLGPNGATIYNGPTNACLQYFEEIGFKCPQYENPPDFFTDVALGQVDRPNDPNFIPEKLLHLWELKQSEKEKPWTRFDDEFEQEEEEGDLHSVDTPIVETAILHEQALKEKNRTPLNFIGQYFLFSLRSLLQLVRHLKGVLFDFVFVAGVASIIGGLYFNLEFIGPMPVATQTLCPPFIKDQCELPRSDKIAIMDLLSTAGLAIPAMQSVLKTFAADKNQFYRDADNGVNKASYFMGKITADLPGFFLFPMLFLSFWYVLIAPLGNFGAYYGLFLLNFWVWTSFGYLVSVLVQRVHAELAGVLYILVSALLGGVNPTIAFMSQQWYTLALVSISPIRWVTEALYLIEIKVYEMENVDTRSALAYYGYSQDNLWKTIVIAFSFGLAYRILAFIVLYFRDPRTQTKFFTLVRVYWRKSKKRLSKLKKKRQANMQGDFGYEFNDNEPIEQVDVEDSDDEVSVHVEGTNTTLNETLLQEDDRN